MNIKNVLIISATLLSVTGIANADTVNSQTEYSRANHSDFSLGFQSSSRVTAVTSQSVENNNEQSNIASNEKGFALGFHGPSKVTEKEENITAKKSASEKKVEDVNKVADSFYIGFNS